MRMPLIIALAISVVPLGVAGQSNVPDQVRAKCAHDWPDDFRMQAFCVNQQVEAATALNARSMQSTEQQMIRRKCGTDWHDDYRMQNFCEEQQLKALASLGGSVSAATAQRPSVPRTAGPYLDSLMGRSAEDVMKTLGAPKEIAGTRWTYATSYGDTVLIYFTDNGKVREVSPKDASIGLVLIKASDKTTEADIDAERRPLSPPAPAQTGAVAKCKDGGFVLVNIGANTCKDNGGVAEWYVEHK